jgi:hypothetical protein
MWNDKSLLYLAEVLKVPVQACFQRARPETEFMSSWKGLRRRDSKWAFLACARAEFLYAVSILQTKNLAKDS